MLDKDPAMFFLPLELCDSNPSEKGLTKKTLVLDMDGQQAGGVQLKNSSSIHLPDTSMWRRLEDSQDGSYHSTSWS